MPAPAATEVDQTIDPTWTIREIADEFDVTHRTVRHYEELGLITPERRGTTRVYHRRDRTRLALILRGKRLGFPLEEIRTIIDLYDRPRGKASQLEYVLGADRRAPHRPRAASSRPRGRPHRAGRVRAPLPGRPRPARLTAPGRRHVVPYGLTSWRSRVLFIGGTGVISSACVAESVAQGWDVTILNRGTSTHAPGPPRRRGPDR